MSAPRVQVTLDADTKKFTSGVDKAMASLRGFLSLGALAGMARAAIELGSRITDLANTSQVSAKWLQEVGYAAKMAGSSIDDVSMAVLELSRAQVQALGGGSGETSAFAALGISIEELRSMNPEQLFDRVARAVQKAEGSAVAMNAAISVMGRGGRKLVGGMADGFDESRQRAQELGLVISDDVLVAMDQMGDTLDTLTLGFTAFSAVVLKNMASLNNWSNLVKAISRIGELSNVGSWVKAFGRGGVAAGGATLSAWAVGNIAALDGIVEDYQSEEDRLDAASGGRRRSGRTPSDVVTARRKGESMKTHEDSLSRIGLYVGGSDGVSHSLLRVQTDALAQLREINRKINERRARGEFDW